MTKDTPFERVGQYLSKEEEYEEVEEDEEEVEEETDVEQGTPKE
jgi:hypothetical protein